MALPELPTLSKKKCFVVTAIGEAGTDTRYNADNVLKHLINPICEELDIEVIRVDQESATGDINQSIINHLTQDDLVIADMTGHNPNAFYELGYRQALGLPLVPIISKNERLPFDVSGYRTVFYSLHVAEIDKSKEELKAMVQSFSNFKMKDQEEQLSEFDIINQKLDDILKYAHDKEIIDKLDKILANTNPSTISNSMIDVEKTLKSAYNVTNRLNLTADDLLKSQARPSILSDTKE